MTVESFWTHGLAGGSKTARDPAALLEDEFDCIVVVPSWDERCVEITKTDGVRATTSIVCLFDNRGVLGLRDDHETRVIAWTQRCTVSTRIVRGASEDVETVWSGVLEAMVDTARAVGRPLRLLVDLSTCPRYYATALLAVGIGRGICSEIVMFYAEAEYPVVATAPDASEGFTVGRWEPIPVPDLHGTYDPLKKRFYLVSVGFEGSKTFTAVARADPDRVGLLFPRPGFQSGYELKSAEQSRQLRDEYDIPDDAVIEAPAGDAIAAWRELTLREIERPEDENSFFLLSGTKPHSVALALRAMSLGSPALLYNRPTTHKELAIKPSGRYWTYRIVDTTAPL